MHDPRTTGPTLHESAPAIAHPLYISPILMGLSSGYRPLPSRACKTCSASMWFSTKGRLIWFYTRMPLMLWDETVPPIITCDGRELALLRQQLEAMEGRAQ